jgi:hypothetical protein
VAAALALFTSLAYGTSNYLGPRRGGRSWAAGRRCVTTMRWCFTRACRCASRPAIEEVERNSGLPTLSAATATTWAILAGREPAGSNGIA